MRYRWPGHWTSPERLRQVFAVAMSAAKAHLLPALSTAHRACGVLSSPSRSSIGQETRSDDEVLVADRVVGRQSVYGLPDLPVLVSREARFAGRSRRPCGAGAGPGARPQGPRRPPCSQHLTPAPPVTVPPWRSPVVTISASVL